MGVSVQVSGFRKDIIEQQVGAPHCAKPDRRSFRIRLTHRQWACFPRKGLRLHPDTRNLML